MTVFELVERMDAREMVLWRDEDFLRNEEARDAALVARAKAAVRSRA